MPTRAQCRLPEPPQALRQLRAQLGSYAVRRLREGKAVLHCWRRSSPWNYWVENKARAREHLWHSGERERPPLWMFQELSRSDQLIEPSSLHSEGGLADHVIYELKPEYRQ